MKLQLDRLRVIVPILGLCFACELSNDLKVKEFHLKFDAGKLSMEYPIELDTVYNWIDASDCTCCHEYKIRLSKSRLDNITESGFGYSGKIPDTVNQITIIQANYPDCDEKHDLHEMLEIRKDKYEETYMGYSLKWLKKEIQIINGKYYTVIGLNVYEGSPKILKNSVVELTTFNNNEWIRVEYKCRNDSCQNYTENTLKLIAGIRLK